MVSKAKTVGTMGTSLRTTAEAVGWAIEQHVVQGASPRARVYSETLSTLPLRREYPLRLARIEQQQYIVLGGGELELARAIEWAYARGMATAIHEA